MKQRRIAYLNGIITTLLLLGILVLAQLIAGRQEFRWDFTDEGRYSLSRQSLDVLALLDGPLVATAFFGENDSGITSVRELFREYQLSYPAFSFSIVNPAKRPELTQQFDVKSHGTVILEYEGARRKIVGVDEERLTNAIYQLMDSRRKTIYFSLGHGEKSREQDGRLLRESLEEEHYRVAPLYLNNTETIPEDASCVVIAGPRTAYLQHEIEQLHRYLERGGSVAVFLDPYQDGGLKSFLRTYGLVLSDMSIVDKVAKLPNGGDMVPAVTSYGSHPITRHLSLTTFFPVARPIDALETVPDRYSLDPLVQTGLSAWAESDRQSLLDGTARFDGDADKAGPLPIAMTVAINRGKDEDASRLVLFGDSDFLADSYLFLAGNRDLALNTIAWAASREGYITVRSRDVRYTPIILTSAQQRAVFWLSLGLMPGLALIAGIWVHVRWMRT